MEQLLDLVQTFVQVERLRFVALTAERHQVVGQCSGAVGRTLHGIDARTRRLEHLEVVLQQFDLAAHHRQHVVEVVGDAAGQPRHRLHLLGLEQLLPEVGALGDVAQGDHLERSGDVAAPQGRFADLDPDDGAASIDQSGLVRVRLVPAGPGELELSAVVGSQRLQLGADQRMVGGGEELAQRTVGLDDAPVERGDGHRHG